MGQFYTEYSEFLAGLFPGIKVQKISIDAGHNCPNRDGTLGRGGCLYCNNKAFSPAYCHTAGSVTTQLIEGKRFFARKYPDMKYLAYFQAYTSTHAPIAELCKAYTEAMNTPDVCGLVIGTRPDCMPDELLDYLAEINRNRIPVIVEYGVETLHDSTLALINRHHTVHCALDAIKRTAEAGLTVGSHLILGLPGETRSQMLVSVRKICDSGVSLLKFHQLQIVKETPLHRIWQQQQEGETPQPSYSDFPEITTFELDDYLNLCADIISIVPRTIAIERFTAQCPPDMLCAPSWGLKNYQFTHRLLNRLRHPSDYML